MLIINFIALRYQCHNFFKKHLKLYSVLIIIIVSTEYNYWRTRMIPFYILGLLNRYGPQHGYQLKKIIHNQLADFTQIKLPTIYYHLEKMEGKGLVSKHFEKSDNRPNKTIYTITVKGQLEFKSKFDELIRLNYQPTFDSDGIFFFAESLDCKKLIAELEKFISKLKITIELLKTHKAETIKLIPKKMQTNASIIFRHHEIHLKAELDWSIETLNSLRQGGIKND